MTDRDPAFLWETEALRSSIAARTAPVDLPVSPPAPSHQWRTLRDAHEATGIPVDTLRKWARRGTVPSFLDLREGDPRRMVRIDAVVARARELGRGITPAPSAGSEPAAPLPAAPASTAAEDAVEIPAGTMIVPIAAWDKMLMQLGNLHEAGQQLAQARERAARAETEASFLRERLAELRAETAAAAAQQAPQEHATEGDAPQPTPAGPGRAAPTWRVLSRRVFAAWRERRRT